MPKTKVAGRYLDDDFRDKIWNLFWRELGKIHSSVKTKEHLKRFLTDSEVTVLEKRLAALYWLSQGESLRDTSKKSGLARRSVIAIKHGFKEPIHRPVKEVVITKDRPERFRVFPSLVSDKIINDLRRGRRKR